MVRLPVRGELRMTVAMRTIARQRPRRLALTLSGGVITDALRALGVQGDGRASPDSSMGIWEATTSLCTNGGFETNPTGWGSTSQGVVARSIAAAKFGVASGSVTSTGAGNNRTITGGTNSLAGSPLAQVARTFSIWVLGSGATIGKTCSFQVNETGGAFGDAFYGGVAPASVVLSAVWQRVTLTGTTTKADRTLLYSFITVPSAGAGEVYYIDGFQVEQKPIATPYVETNGATASRAAARVPAPASLLNATQGWVAMRVRMGWPSASVTLVSSTDPRFMWWGVNDSRICISPTTVTVQLISDTGPNDIVNAACTWAAGDIITVIAAWTATHIKISANGAAFSAPVARTAVPTLASATFGIGYRDEGGGSGELDSDILWFACRLGTLTDADAAMIHGFGNTDPSFYALPATAMWNADTAIFEGMFA